VLIGGDALGGAGSSAVCLPQIGYADVVLPEAERAATEVLSLPMSPELTMEQVGHVVEGVKEFFQGSSKLCLWASVMGTELGMKPGIVE
jgi:hypothetical protein